MRIDIPPEGITYYWQDNPVMAIKPGAAEGPQYVTVIVHNGDIIGHRNEQGGSIDTGQTDDINLDIGAGNSTQRGWVSLNPDVGKGTILGSGRNRELARFAGSDDPAKDLITFSAPLRLKRGLYVPDGAGAWRKVAL